MESGDTAAPDGSTSVEDARPVAPDYSASRGLKPIDTNKWAGDRGNKRMDDMLDSEGHVGKKQKGGEKRPPTVREARDADIARAAKASARDPLKPTTSEDRDTDTTTDSGERARDESGRFVASAKTEGEQSAEPAQATANEPPVAAAPPSTKHKFAGREFDTPEAAERYTTELEWHQTRAAESAKGWKQAYDRLKAELDSGAQARPASLAPQAQAAQSGDNSPDTAGLDEETVGYMWDVAIEHANAGDKSAFGKFYGWLAQETQAAAESKFNAKFAEISKPWQEQQAQVALHSEIGNNWQALGNYTGPSGQPLFPEVNDPKASHDIGIYLSQLNFPPDFLKTQAGLMAGIGLYRAMTGSTPQPPAATPPNYPTAPSTPSDAGAVLGGPDVAPRNVGPDPMSPETRRLHSALDLAKKRGGADSGFSR